MVKLTKRTLGADTAWWVNPRHVESVDDNAPHGATIFMHNRSTSYCVAETAEHVTELLEADRAEAKALSVLEVRLGRIGDAIGKMGDAVARISDRVARISEKMR